MVWRPLSKLGAKLSLFLFGKEPFRHCRTHSRRAGKDEELWVLSDFGKVSPWVARINVTAPRVHAFGADFNEMRFARVRIIHLKASDPCSPFHLQGDRKSTRLNSSHR